MFTLKHENKYGRLFTILFFVCVAIEVTAEMFSNKLLIYIFKPLLSIGIMVLYWNVSTVKKPLFFTVIFLSMITNILFIPNTYNMLIIALLVFMIHRILLIYYVVQVIKIKDFIPLFIAILPFLFIFFYLLTITSDSSAAGYIVLIFQNILISIVGGLALSEYVMNYNKMNAWLFIFGLLSVMQYFIVFIEKYYLMSLAPIAFRPLAMLLNASVLYTFYRFIIDAEKKNNKLIVLDND